MADKDQVVVQKAPGGASIELPRSLAAAMKPGTPVKFFGFGPDAALLLRDGIGEEGFFAGSLSSFSIAEVLGQAVSGVRSGKLIVVSEAAFRTVSLRDGQILFATSSEPYERLGSILVRLKLATEDQIQAAAADVKPGMRLGQVLTRKGVLSASSLFTAMTHLVRDIVLNVFDLVSGDFLFLEGKLPNEDEIKLPERTKDIVLAGIKRAEETARLRMKFPPSLEVRTGKVAGAEGDAPVLKRVGSGLALGTLRPEFPGSEHAFLTWVEQSLQRGVLAQGKAPAPAPAKAVAPKALSVLERYEALVKMICDALGSAGESTEDLNSFFQDPLPGMEKAFSGVQLEPDGSVQFQRVVDNFGGSDKPLARAKAYEAIDAFVSYALFSAKNKVPAKTAASLASEFRKLHQEGA